MEAEALRGVGFTGSEGGRRALYDLAAARDVPIPVYAEMSSLNPVFMTEAAPRERGPELAEGLAGPMTLGNGQFCTKPGDVFLPVHELDTFAERLVEQFEAMEPTESWHLRST